MTIQIIGTKNDFNTQKAVRYFKERKIDAHFRDVKVKPLSPGEVDNITRSVPPGELIDESGKEYKKGGYQYREFDPREEVLEKPLLMKMPVVRAGGKAAVGYRPDVWEEWVNE